MAISQHMKMHEANENEVHTPTHLLHTDQFVNGNGATVIYNAQY